MSEKGATDYRKFPRRKFTAKVRIHDHIHGKWIAGEAVDINPMGLLLVPRRTLNLGEIITVSFPSPEGDYDLSVNGEVVRVDDGKTSRKPGAAVEFFGLDDWVFEELCRFVFEGKQDLQLTVTVSPSHGSQ